MNKPRVRRCVLLTAVCVAGLSISAASVSNTSDAELIEKFTPFAQGGSVEAQIALGDLFSKVENHQEALKWYRLAAEQDNPLAQFQLALIITEARGVRRDYGEAAKWYRQAAGHGVAEAQNNLGVLYSRGLGVPKNIVYAYMWFLVSASSIGEKPVLLRQNSDNTQRQMGDEQKTRARKMADQCIATMFKECGDVLPEIQASFAALQASAGNGNADAQFKLAQAYDTGTGTPKNEGDAVKWYLASAKAGNRYAQHVAGTLYTDGRGVIADASEAVKYWRLAAAQGVSESQGSLGAMYYSGQGVPKDLTRAYMWLDVAASSSNAPTAEKAKQFRDIVAMQLSPEELVDARGKAERCAASKYEFCN